MTANAGTIEAQLILNASQFQKGMQAAMNSANSAAKGMSGASNNVSKGFSAATGQLNNFSKAVNEARTHATGLGQSVIASSQKATSAFGQMTAAASRVGTGVSSAFQRGGRAIMSMGNTLANLTNSVVSFNVWMGALVGKVFYDFTIGAAMATKESLSLFKFVGMSANEVNRLEKATSAYAKSASKVSQPEMLASWKIIRVSQKLSADEMIKYQGVMGDTIGLFKTNGRTAEDAGRAIEDAMAGGADGIKRLKEIGITDMEELTRRGFDPSKPASFFAALQKLYKDRGVEGYGSKITSLADRFENLKEQIQLAGIAAGEILMPAMEMFVNGFTAVFGGLGPAVAGFGIAISGLLIILGFFWPTLQTIGSGIALVASRLIMAAASATLYSGATVNASKSTVVLGLAADGAQKSILGMNAAMAASVAVFAAALVVLAAAVWHIGQYASASASIKRVESERNEQVKSFTATNTYLNKVLNDQRARAATLNEQNKSTTQINKEIAATQTAIKNNTDAAANAQNRYNEYVRVSQGLKDLSGERKTVVGPRITHEESQFTAEKPPSATGDALYDLELERQAKAYNDMNGPAFTYAGTLKRINDGHDAYSKYWQNNKKQYDDYKQEYKDFIVANTNFRNAIEKGDYPGMIYYGIERAFRQAKVGVTEMGASIIAGWDGFWKKQKEASEKSVSDATAYWRGAWNNTMAWFSGLIGRLSSLWGETAAYFQGAWNNTVNAIRGAWSRAVGTILGAWNRLKTTVQKGISGAIHIAGGALYTAYNAAKRLYNYISNGVTGTISLVQTIFGAKAGPGALTSPGSSAARKGLSMAHSAGPIDMLKNAMGGIGYEHYYGNQKTPAQVMADGAGNCVDTTLTAMRIAGSLGMDSRMEMGTWAGGGHVWGSYGGHRLDFARKSLDNTYLPPLAGPGKGRGNVYVFNGPVYNWKEFKRDVAKANDQIVRN